MNLWVTLHDVMEMQDDRHFLVDESSGQELPVPVGVVDDLEDWLLPVEDRPARVDTELRRLRKWKVALAHSISA